MNRLFILIMFVALKTLNAQEITETRKFEDLETKLYKTHIIKLDTLLKRDELKNKFKNVTSTMFMNLKEVMVSETDDQIVLSYISNTSTRPSTPWNIRLIGQFKDGKVRLLFYDDGNVYIPSSQYTPAWNASSFYVTDNKRAVKNARITIMNEWMDNADATIKKIEDVLRKSISKTDKDW